MSTSGPAWVPARLAHLRRDARGLPVPFVNAWGPPDDVRLLAVRYDAAAGCDALYRDDGAEPVPDFLHQSPQRQRWCVQHGWCQICGRPVPWSRRFLVLSSISLTVINVGGRERVAVTEPWLCEQDARLAMEHCPALIRRRRDDDLHLLQIQRAGTDLARSMGWVEGPLEKFWLKIVIPLTVLPAGLNLRASDARDATLAAQQPVGQLR